MELRKATIADIDRIMSILDDARAFQRSMGFRQWKDGYPDRPTILSDIASGNARLLIDNTRETTLPGTPSNILSANVLDSQGEISEILGYCLLAVGDDSYDSLDHDWFYPGPYGVIHRFAMAPEARGKGLASIFLTLIEQDYLSRGVTSLRVDTGAENLIMQRLLHRRHYHPHGLLPFPWGPRLTYEKSLTLTTNQIR